MNQLLMRAVVEYAIFLGLSEETDVNPDVAVSQLEQLTSILRQLDPVERKEFISFIQTMRDAESQNPRSQKRVEFLNSLTESLGLE
jgi:hypothetical protein